MLEVHSHSQSESDILIAFNSKPDPCVTPLQLTMLPKVSPTEHPLYPLTLDNASWWKAGMGRGWGQ